MSSRDSFTPRMRYPKIEGGAANRRGPSGEERRYKLLCPLTSDEGSMGVLMPEISEARTHRPAMDWVRRPRVAATVLSANAPNVGVPLPTNVCAAEHLAAGMP